VPKRRTDLTLDGERAPVDDAVALQPVVPALADRRGIFTDFGPEIRENPGLIVI
jgi:hypothetical protein